MSTIYPGGDSQPEFNSGHRIIAAMTFESVFGSIRDTVDEDNDVEIFRDSLVELTVTILDLIDDIDSKTNAEYQNVQDINIDLHDLHEQEEFIKYNLEERLEILLTRILSKITKEQLIHLLNENDLTVDPSIIDDLYFSDEQDLTADTNTIVEEFDDKGEPPIVVGQIANLLLQRYREQIDYEDLTRAIYIYRYNMALKLSELREDTNKAELLRAYNILIVNFFKPHDVNLSEDIKEGIDLFGWSVLKLNASYNAILDLDRITPDAVKMLIEASYRLTSNTFHYVNAIKLIGNFIDTNLEYKRVRELFEEMIPKPSVRIALEREFTELTWYDLESRDPKLSYFIAITLLKAYQQLLLEADFEIIAKAIQDRIQKLYRQEDLFRNLAPPFNSIN